MFSLWHSELDLCSIIATFCNAKSKQGKCQQKPKDKKKEKKKRAKTKTKEINNNNKNETKTLKKPPTKPISMKVAIFGGVWKKMIIIVMWVVLLRLLKSIFGSDVDVCDRNTVRRRHNRSTVFWNRKACLDNVSALLASSTKSVLRY